MLRRLMHNLETAHWRQEHRRKTHPFRWGVEHVGGAASEADPKGFLLDYAENWLRGSDTFFSTRPAESYDLRDGVLRFPSAIESPYPENNTVTARWFPSEKANGRAVLVLPQWNAQPESHVAICRWFQRVNISALRLSMPYHDERQPRKYERADPLVSPNIGLTLQANRQAVLDVRRALLWLEQEGFDRVGIVGTSIGSCVAFITMCHEPALRVGAFLHVSTRFGDVVRTGMTTDHVWAGIQEHLTADELRRIWDPISPFPYIPRMRGRRNKMLLISALYDLSFRPELSCQLWEEMGRQGIEHEKLMLPCGHYSLGKFPFNWWTGLRFIPFVRKQLSKLQSSRKSPLEERFGEAD